MVRTTNCALSSRSNGEDQEEYLSLLFLVQDTGIGMTPEQASKSFDVFSQVDSSSTRQHEGTGLGLAITRRLCQLMGGQVALDSTPGVGSTFTITIPAVLPGAHVSYPQLRSTPCTSTASSAPFKGRKRN